MPDQPKPAAKVAVAAASGRLGHATLRHLAAEIGARRVVGIARSPEKIRIEGIEKRAGDYASERAMAAALQGVSTLVMISAPVKPDTDRVALHHNVIEAARRAGTGCVIYTSVVGRDVGPDSLFYAAQQVNRRTEAELAAAGFDWIVVRNGLYLELDIEHIIRADAGERVYRNPGGEGRAPYITIEELGYAMARLAAGHGQPNRIYNLGGECLSQASLVELANRVFGLKVRYETESDEACIQKFRELMPERGEAVARMLTGCFQCIRRGEFDVASDYESAAGRPPRTMLQMMEDCRERRAAARA